MSSQDQMLQGNCSRCGHSRTRSKCRQTTKYIQDKQTSKQTAWSGTDDKRQAPHGQRQGQARQRQRQRQKQKQKSQEKSKHRGKKGKNISYDRRGTTPRKTHKPVGSAQNGRIHVVITLTTGLTQTGGPVTGAQILGMDLHGEPATRQLTLQQPAPS